MKNKLILGALLLTGCTETPRSLLPDLGTPDLSVVQPPPADLSGLKYEPVDFSVPPATPTTITAVSPHLAPTTAGTPITVTGTNFSSQTEFFINNAVVNVMSVTPTTAVLLTPPRPGVGPAIVAVRNPNGTSAATTIPTAPAPVWPTSGAPATPAATQLTYYATQMAFNQIQTATDGTNARGASFGDINGDGFTDVVLSHVSSSNYVVFLGDGTGSFAPYVSTTFGGPSFAVVGGQVVFTSSHLADLNNDGHLDLVLATTSNNMAYYLGNGQGPFNQIAVTNYGTSAAPVYQLSVDFNSDGYLDLITANENSNNIGLFFNSQSQGNLYSSGQYQVLNPGGSPSRVMTYDIDGDGKQDLVASLLTNGGSTLAVYFGTGNQSTPFNGPTLYGTNSSNQQPTWFEFADFNQDGKIDVVTCDNNTSTMRVFLGNGTNTNSFQNALNPVSVGLNPQQLSTGDFNGDGKPDVIVANTNTNNVSLFLGNGDGTFQPRIDFASLNTPWAIYSTLGVAGNTANKLVPMDLNGDGKTDFAVVNQTNAGGNSPGYLTVYLNTSQ